MNIEEIALRVAQQLCSEQPPAMQYGVNAEFTINFAHAILAELSKDAEPSFWQWQDSDYVHHFTTNPTKAPEYATKYFTHPAPVIASEQKPVAYLSRHFASGTLDLDIEGAGSKDGWSAAFPVFTSPPNTADIEQRVAEACAKMADDKDVERTDYCMHVYEEGEQYKSDLIADIKASKWKEYL